MLVGESFTLVILSEAAIDFCLTGTGGGVTVLDIAYIHTLCKYDLLQVSMLCTSCRTGGCLLEVTGLGLLTKLFSL